MDRTKEEKLLAAIGDIDDELILAADESAGNVVLFPRKRRWQSVALTAACLLLCFGAWQAVGGLFGKTTSAESMAPQAAETPSSTTITAAPESVVVDSVMEETESEELKEDESPAESAGEANPTTGGPGVGGSNTDNDPYKKYSEYFAPVLPLTAEGDTEGILAERSVDITEIDEEIMSLSDSYLLTNSTAVDKTLTIQYRYGESLAVSNSVEMVVDGSAESQELFISENISDYESSADYTDALGSWQTYSKKLDGLDYTLNEGKYKGDEEVFVYTISDVVLPGGAEKGAQTALEFSSSAENLVLTTELYGYCVNEEERDFYRLYVPSRRTYPMQIISYGEELSELTVKAFRGEEELKLEVQYDSSVESMTLQEALSKVYRQYVQENGQQSVNSVSEEQVLDALLCQLDGLPFRNENYRNQAVVELPQVIYDTITAQRLYVLEQSITIPAGATVSVEISMEKQLSNSGDGLGFELIGQSQTVFDLQSFRLYLTEDAKVLSSTLPQKTGQMELDADTDVFVDLEKNP